MYFELGLVHKGNLHGLKTSDPWSFIVTLPMSLEAKRRSNLRRACYYMSCIHTTCCPAVCALLIKTLGTWASVCPPCSLRASVGSSAFWTSATFAMALGSNLMGHDGALRRGSKQALGQRGSPKNGPSREALKSIKRMVHSRAASPRRL